MFVELPQDNFNFEIKTISQEKLDIDINDIINNDIILISSGTATGKTTAIGKLSNEIKTKLNSKMLSIVNLISLSRQQITTFREEGAQLNNYQLGINDFNKDDGVICINSLHKLLTLEDYDYGDKVIYIDECNDLIRALTHNEQMNKILMMTYELLVKLIKNCKKVIITDATIDNNTINLLSSRKQNNKTILIKNTFKKFDKIKANRYLDETLFINKIKDNIKNKKYFLFGCDGCEKITKLFKLLLDEFPEQKDDFILFTGKESNKVQNPKEQFKNKYVFYSPTITTGVSFIYKDVKQDQFIYITNKPLITPVSIYQMSCRTRNMKELHFYCSDLKPSKMTHETLKDVEKEFKKMKKLNNRLLGLSVSRNEDDEIKVVENTFFKLFCYNEYLDEIYKTGFLQHYENILIRDGFEIKEIGVKRKIHHEIIKAENEVYQLMKDEEYEKFVEIYFKPFENEYDLQEIDEMGKKYPIFTKIIHLLQISTIEDAIKYRELITNDYKLKNYFSTLNLFKTKEYIRKKELEYKTKIFDVRILSTSVNMVSLLEMFEKHYQIERFEFDITKFNTENEISKDFQTLYKKLYPRKTVKDFNDVIEIYKIYGNLLKDICGDMDIIKTNETQKRYNGKKYRPYSLDIDKVNDVIYLVKQLNPELKFYNIELIETLTGIKPEKEKKKVYYITDFDNDDEDLFNSYIFGKTNGK